ncbi:MAG: hypothetical protein ACRYGF_15930 [Janthinobacterium lividum]
MSLLRSTVSLAACLLLAVPYAPGQAERHGRKYKAPPETSHFEVLVVKDSNGKILENAAVIFHPSMDGIEEGNLEVKSGTDGKAFIDVIPTGSDVTIQVISNGYATYAGTVKLTKASQQLIVRMVKPQAQISAYEDVSGEPSKRRVGVQEPVVRTAPAASPKPLAASEPVLKLPTLPKNAAAKGDASVPADHNVTPPPLPPAKQPNKSSAPLGTTVDGTAGSSPSSN